MQISPFKGRKVNYCSPGPIFRNPHLLIQILDSFVHFTMLISITIEVVYIRIVRIYLIIPNSSYQYQYFLPRLINQIWSISFWVKVLLSWSTNYLPMKLVPPRMRIYVSVYVFILAQKFMIVIASKLDLIIVNYNFTNIDIF